MAHILLEADDCKVCNGIGKVYMVNRLYKEDSLEKCSNCHGLGIVAKPGTFQISFKTNDSLPKTVRKF